MAHVTFPFRYLYAGILNKRYCECSNNISLAVLDDDSACEECDGRRDVKCGGSSRYSVYSLENLTQIYNYTEGASACKSK